MFLVNGIPFDTIICSCLYNGNPLTNFWVTTWDKTEGDTTECGNKASGVFGLYNAFLFLLSDSKHLLVLLLTSSIDHLAGKYLSFLVTTSSPITFIVALHIGQIESFSISSKYRVSTGKFRLSKSSLIRESFFFLNLVVVVVCFLSLGMCNSFSILA